MSQEKISQIRCMNMLKPIVDDLRRVDYFYWLDMPVWTVVNASFILCRFPPSYDDEMYFSMPAKVAKTFTLLNRYAIAGKLHNDAINEIEGNNFSFRPINYIRLVKSLGYSLSFIVEIYFREEWKENACNLFLKNQIYDKSRYLGLNSDDQKIFVTGFKALQNASDAGKESAKERKTREKEKTECAIKIAFQILNASSSNVKTKAHHVELVRNRTANIGNKPYSASSLIKKFNKNKKILELLKLSTTVVINPH